MAKEVARPPANLGVILVCGMYLGVMAGMALQKELDRNKQEKLNLSNRLYHLENEAAKREFAKENKDVA